MTVTWSSIPEENLRAMISAMKSLEEKLKGMKFYVYPLSYAVKAIPLVILAAFTLMIVVTTPHPLWIWAVTCAADVIVAALWQRSGLKKTIPKVLELSPHFLLEKEKMEESQKLLEQCEEVEELCENALLTYQIKKYVEAAEKCKIYVLYDQNQIAFKNRDIEKTNLRVDFKTRKFMFANKVFDHIIQRGEIDFSKIDTLIAEAAGEVQRQTEESAYHSFLEYETMSHM